MVTSNNLPDKKVVKMCEPTINVVVPQRTLLGEINEHIMCPLCRGYYIDATTIVECLHSFCRSCIIKHLQVKSYCPVCEMMINSAKPNIKPDKALQDIVYKLVPGLFQREMERRQQFYASRPGPAASATPEQRGEDTERIIFSPEDVISFSLEFADVTDTDSISSKSSDSSEPQTATTSTRRFLQCPAVVNISHLKKFISMKFDIDSSQFSIDILYKRVPLPDYYTLMDIAYIYNWKRNEPMKFFYQITDFTAIRNRYGLFDINRKGSHFGDRKPSPAPTDDTNASSPATTTNEPGFETSSGTDSPMLEDSTTSCKKAMDTNLRTDHLKKEIADKCKTSVPVKTDDEVEKSQFLNSFELKAAKYSPDSKNQTKTDNENKQSTHSDTTSKVEPSFIKLDDSPIKRKSTSPISSTDVKKMKTEANKNFTGQVPNKTLPNVPSMPSKLFHSFNQNENIRKEHSIAMKSETLLGKSQPAKEFIMPNQPIVKPSALEIPSKKVTDEITSSPPKPKTSKDVQTSATKPIPALKLQPTRHDSSGGLKPIDGLKPSVKRIPDLKPSVPPFPQMVPRPKPKVTKFQMDLLANNSDPTIDRSKIMSQVKSSMAMCNSGQKPESWKSLFASGNINIPSSLSITLTDQKLDQRNPNDSVPIEAKKNIVNKKLVATGTASVTGHKVPSPPVHNYIEILKLPETDNKNQTNKVETNTKQNANTKTDINVTSPKPSTKTELPTSEKPSSKGPIPSLKPIADTKLNKTPPNNSSPITFQQTFEQQIQSIQTDKPKAVKTKTQVPKLMPATPKAIMAASKLNNMNKVATSLNTLAEKPTTTTGKPDNALDLSTAHEIVSQLGVQDAKAFELMQSIYQSANLPKKQNTSKTGSSPSTSDSKTEQAQKPDNALDLTTPHNVYTPLDHEQKKRIELMHTIDNLARKQNPPTKPVPAGASQRSVFSGISGRLTSGTVPHRNPHVNISMNQSKSDKVNMQKSASTMLKPEIKPSNSKVPMDSQHYKYPSSK